MKKLLFIITLTLGFFSCSQDQVIEIPDQNTDNPATKAANLSYTLDINWQNESINAQLKPGPMYADGNNFYVTNIASGSYSIRVYNLISKKISIVIDGWRWDGQQETMQDEPTALCVYNGKIYMTVKNKALIYVINASYPFDLHTIIGTGVEAAYPVVSGQECMMGIPVSLAVADGKLVVRDQNIIRTYNIAEITTANYQAIPRYNSSIDPMPTPADIGIQSCADAFGQTYMADKINKYVYLTKPVGNLPSGDRISFFNYSDYYKIDTDHLMRGMTIFSNRMYYSAEDNNVYESTEDAVVLQNVGTVAKYSFRAPAYLTGAVDIHGTKYLFVADTDRVLGFFIGRKKPL